MSDFEKLLIVAIDDLTKAVERVAEEICDSRVEASEIAEGVDEIASHICQLMRKAENEHHDTKSAA